eukprot:jgi/Psemu1/307697/fgenesh1_kg.347_\
MHDASTTKPPTAAPSDDLESVGRGLSSSKGTDDSSNKEENADPFTTAANIILPRLNNMNQNPLTKAKEETQPLDSSSSSLEQSDTKVPTSSEVPELPSTTTTTSSSTSTSTSTSSSPSTTRLRSPLSPTSLKTTVSAKQSPTTALHTPPTTASTTAPPSPSSVVPFGGSNPSSPSLTSAHGTSIVLNILSHTKAFASGLIRKTWKICRGFILRFHFFQPGERRSGQHLGGQ